MKNEMGKQDIVVRIMKRTDDIRISKETFEENFGGFGMELDRLSRRLLESRRFSRTAEHRFE